MSLLYENLRLLKTDLYCGLSFLFIAFQIPIVPTRSNLARPPKPHLGSGRVLRFVVQQASEREARPSFAECRSSNVARLAHVAHDRMQGQFRLLSRLHLYAHMHSHSSMHSKTHACIHAYIELFDTTRCGATEDVCGHLAWWHNQGRELGKGSNKSHPGRNVERETVAACIHPSLCLRLHHEHTFWISKGPRCR